MHYKTITFQSLIFKHYEMGKNSTAFPINTGKDMDSIDWINNFNRSQYDR